MVKEDLVCRVSDNTGIRKQDIRNIVNNIMEEIKAALGRKEDVSLVGFGTFELANRKARRGRNPQTNEIMNIPEHKTPVFRFGRHAKEQIMK